MPRSALAVETHENWLEQHRYLNLDDLREHKKEGLRHGSLVSPWAASGSAGNQPLGELGV